MPDWDRGYFTRLPYTYGYYREMAPAHLQFCLLQKGLVPPAENGLNYCELAMGQGYSASIHAAANYGNFYGMDFMPDHAIFAKNMAMKTGNGLTVVDASFEEFALSTNQDFDIICLHGGWSWISAENRKIIRDFLYRHLKPGGIFYISYNCWPGWSSAAPLRKLFTTFSKWYTSPGMAPEERIAASLTLTEGLIGCDPLFLNSSSWIKERFESLKKESPAYLAHEFFNEDWHITWFSDLAEDLFKAKLTFGASAKTCDNIPGFGFTRDAERFLENVPSPLVREQLKDFFCNTQFRTDIFIKGSLPLANMEKTLSQQRFVLSKLPEEMDLTLECGMGVYNLDKNLYNKLVGLLAENQFTPKNLVWLHEKLASVTDMRTIFNSLARLISKGYVQPCKSGISRLEACAEFNRYILEFPYLEYLASPLTGSALKISSRERVPLKEEFYWRKSGEKTGAPKPLWPEDMLALRNLFIAHGILQD